MNYFIKILGFIFLVSFGLATAHTIVIDQPGFISLGNDINEPGFDFFQITVSNVILDLNEHVISNGDSGVIVDPDLSNIIIRNGTITNQANHGILIGQNCSTIRLENLTISSCGQNGVKAESGVVGTFITDSFLTDITQAAISIKEDTENIRVKNLTINYCGGPAVELIGSSTGNRVRDVLLEEITTLSCSLSSTYSHVFYIQYGENITLNSIGITNGGNELCDVRLIELENCERCNVKNVRASGNSGGSLRGISLINTQSSIFQFCNVLNNEALTGKFKGFDLTSGSINNFFENCCIFTSSSSNDSAYGFDICQLSKENMFKECNVAALKGVNVYGFDITGSSVALEFNILEHCQVTRCLATTENVIGYHIGNADKGTLSCCVASYNNAPSGVAVGLLMRDGDGGNLWTTNECKFVRNIGDSDANSFGIKIETGIGNIFSRNFAFDNGNTAANQMYGVPAGSVTQLNPSNLNTADSPWANIVVTPQ